MTTNLLHGPQPIEAARYCRSARARVAFSASTRARSSDSNALRNCASSDKIDLISRLRAVSGSDDLAPHLRANVVYARVELFFRQVELRLGR